MSVHLNVPACKYCGRIVLVGWCCEARRDWSRLFGQAFNLRRQLLEVLKVARAHMSNEQLKPVDRLIRETHELA